MPSIEVEGHSDAQFVLKDGKIVRVESRASESVMRGPEAPEARGPQGPHA